MAAANLPPPTRRAACRLARLVREGRVVALPLVLEVLRDRADDVLAIMLERGGNAGQVRLWCSRLRRRVLLSALGVVVSRGVVAQARLGFGYNAL